MRVLDLSRLFPGPYCACILADFGADVIKIEAPGNGDWVRAVPPLDETGQGRLFGTLNRGKRGLTLDLKAEEGRSILLRLIETADVLLEGFRPGVMDRLGLGYEQVAPANPGLVYCSLSGYGAEGPYRGRPGHDLGYVGLSGLLDLTGPRDGPPAALGAPVADMTGALWAAVGILLALLERQHTGRGGRVDASLLGGALSCLPVAVAHELGGRSMARGGDPLTGGAVCYNIYPAADGYVTLTALEPEFWLSFCRAVGREDLADQAYAPALPGEPAYEALCELFRTRPRREWAEVLAAADACCEPVYRLGEALASAPVQALRMVTAEGLLPPLRLGGRPVPVPRPAPALGQHTAEILAEVGYGAGEVERLRGLGVV